MINRIRCVPLVVALICTLGSTACHSTGDPSRQPNDALAVDSTSAPLPLPVSNFEAIDVISGTDGTVVAIGPDSSFVVAQQNEERPDLTIKSHNANSVKVTHPSGARTTWFGEASINEHWLVWTELRDTDATVRRWTMYAYDRLKGSVQILMEAPLLDDGEAPPAPPGYSGHALAGNWVYWPQVTGRVGDVDSDLYRCSLSNCDETTTLVDTGAAFPKADGESVYYIKKSEDQVFDVWSTEAGDAPTLISSLDAKPNENLNGFAVSGQTLVVAYLGQSGTRVWAREGENPGTNIMSSENGALGYPVAGSGVFAWAESSGTSELEVGGFAWLDGHLYTIGNASGLYAISAGGALLTWQEDRDGQIVTVVARMST